MDFSSNVRSIHLNTVAIKKNKETFESLKRFMFACFELKMAKISIVIST